MGPPPWPLSPCPVSPLVSWPAPVSESELEVFPWSPPDVLLCPVSSLARLGLLETISSKQRQSANRQEAAMLREWKLSTHLGRLKCSGQPQIECESLIPVPCLLLLSQVSFTLFSHMSTSLFNLCIAALSLPRIQLFIAGEAQPILMLVCLLPLYIQTS